MSRRLDFEANRLRSRLQRGDPAWPAQLSVGAAIGLHFLLSDRVTVGPGWLLPSVEGALLLALIVIAPARASEHSPWQRRFALTVVAIVSVTTIVSLALLIHYLVVGGKAGGQPLILSGVVLWATNVLLFGVWYWEMDRGGPVRRHMDTGARPDFQFPQMENPQFAPPGWRPGFGDYMYTSLTNATAFSPTDTMPLTLTAKTVMGMQSVAALATIGLVVARAVNILN